MTDETKTENLTFKSGSGTTTWVAEECDHALALMNYAKGSHLSANNDGFKAFNILLANHLLNIHYGLYQMTESGPSLKDLEAKDCRQYFPSKYDMRFVMDLVAFVRGAVCDPFLFAIDEPYQQAAVMGLHKATGLVHDLLVKKDMV